MPKLQFCDIFCAVIDNFGDIGVCWRLACDLASHGMEVRLWVDDATALQWMAPPGHASVARVKVLPWNVPLDLTSAALVDKPCELLIEAFGCDVAPEFLEACVKAQQTSGQTGQAPTWINLEYLSAEPYVERSHALPCLVRSGPAAGWTKWFFYPGFTPLTGGLLREPQLLARQTSFDRRTWLNKKGIDWQGEKLVSLFCYEPAALAKLLEALAAEGLAGEPVKLLVTAGRAEKAVKALTTKAKATATANSLKFHESAQNLLSISYLPPMPQLEYDQLLWACDLNFVRGEDSLIRAIWASKPFVWQIYPQDDDAHLIKLKAFMDQMGLPTSLNNFYLLWNGNHASEASENGLFLTLPDADEWALWQGAARAAQARLMTQPDLVTQLLGFVAKKR